MIKGFGIRLYPTKEQERKMWQHIGCCRFIWNYMIELQQKRFQMKEQHLSGFAMTKMLTKIKNDGEHEWLYEVSNASLQMVCQNLGDTYKKFFKKKCGYPKFKSKKKSRPAYPVRTDCFYFLDARRVFIAKLGYVCYKGSFNFPVGNKQHFTMPQVVFRNGKWILSFGMECENQAQELTNHSMGIDLGIKELAIVEFNGQCKVFHNINKSKKMKKLAKRLTFFRKKQFRQYGSNPKNKSGPKAKGTHWKKSENIIKTENKIRKIHAKITNIRTNYIHQATHELVSMKPCKVVMEGLDVSVMLKNKFLSGKIIEMCWFEFIKTMKYKCEWNGIEFIQVDRFYPSSKTCSCCGNIKKNLKLSDRTYICDICGLKIDRDYNAAINLSRC